MSQQMSMFTNGEDAPLFSGTPQKGHRETFKPQASQQLGLGFSCAVCRDTGTVNRGDKTVYCTCEAGQEARQDQT